MLKTLLTIAALASGAICAAAPGAGSPRAANASNDSPLYSPEKTGAWILIATYDANGNGQGAPLVPFGFTTVATNTVQCTVAAGCAIGIESMVQIQPAGQDWAICYLVDDASVSCQYQGVISSVSSYVTGNARAWVASVGKGAHVVTTQVYADGVGAAYQYFQTDTSVYKR